MLDCGFVRTQRMDPQLRKLLEVTHEAWVDSGVDVKQLRGSDKVWERQSGWKPACSLAMHALHCFGHSRTGESR